MVSIKSCNFPNVYLDSITFSNDWGNEELSFVPLVEFPYYLSNDSLCNIGQLKFYAKYTGTKTGYMVLHFRNYDGTIFLRYFGLRSYVEEPLSVPDENANLDNGFLIYPNPSDGLINIKTNLAMPAKINIINLLGEKILETDIKSQKTNINLNGKVQNGVYFIILENRLSRFVKKLMVNY